MQCVWLSLRSPSYAGTVNAHNFLPASMGIQTFGTICLLTPGARCGVALPATQGAHFCALHHPRHQCWRQIQGQGHQHQPNHGRYMFPCSPAILPVPHAECCTYTTMQTVAHVVFRLHALLLLHAICCQGTYVLPTFALP